MPLITLSSDIGTHDYMTAAIKGQLMQLNSSFQILDITHQLSPFNYPQAAYIIRSAIKSFPQESFHVVMVNFYDEKIEHLLLAEHEGQFIACADNGLLTMILETTPDKLVALPLEKSRTKNTLYCIQVIGDAFNELLAGKKLEQLGDVNVDYKIKNALRPMLSTDWIEGQVLLIDNFENVVVNITKTDFENQRKGRSFHIVFKRDEKIDKISETYADVPEGEKLALFNSAGYLEIAINKGNAAGLFGLQGYSEKLIKQGQVSFDNKHSFYQTIQVIFK